MLRYLKCRFSRQDVTHKTIWMRMSVVGCRTFVLCCRKRDSRSDRCASCPAGRRVVLLLARGDDRRMSVVRCLCRCASVVVGDAIWIGFTAASSIRVRASRVFVNGVTYTMCLCNFAIVGADEI